MKMNKGAVVAVAPLEDAAGAHSKEVVCNNNKTNINYTINNEHEQCRQMESWAEMSIVIIMNIITTANLYNEFFRANVVVVVDDKGQDKDNHHHHQPYEHEHYHHYYDQHHEHC